VSDPVYCIDSSALVGPFRYRYRHTVFQGLWRKVHDLVLEGRLIAPDEVFKELLKQEDELTVWARQHESMFIKPTQFHSTLVSEIGVKFPALYTQPTSSNEAEPWVVALARDRNCPVVTHEGDGSEKNPKIPYICQHYKIKKMGFLDVVFAEGWVFP